ncbi:hypothetical protein ACSLPC_28285 [Escherichia coli]|uniref:hypothetical protein n=1 Tax=Escherichia coli TaxID=562 RepID=UPI003EE1A805
MNNYLIWYTTGIANVEVPRIIQALTQDHAKEIFTGLGISYNRIISIQEHID